MSNVDPQKKTSNETDGKTGQAEDTFGLTATTFAGTTQMTETGPGGDGPWVPVVPVKPMTADDHARLIVEAEMRAEHQAQARATMLDLARALDESNRSRRELADKLRHQEETSNSLQTLCDRLQRELDRIHDAEEKKKAEALVKKALASGNKFFFNMMLEKSRDVYDFSLFEPEGAPNASPEQPKPVEEEEANQSAVKETPKSLADLVGGGAAGDKVTVKWVVKLWWQEVLKTKARLEEERLERLRKQKEEDERRRIQDAIRAAQEKVAKQVEDLKNRLENSLKTIEENEKRIAAMEKELQAARDKAAQDAAEAKAREDALKAENARLQAEKADLQKGMAEMQAMYDASQEALRKAAEDFAADRNALNQIIRNINSELQEAMVMAKHMRELAMKAKREAANSVSPQKFAELMAHLEEMKNNLAALMKELNLEKDNSASLLRNLDKNKRQLELERQFLPLLRKVRGPVGPKAKGGQDERSKDIAPNSQAAGMPPIGQGASPKTLRGSQSLGALSNGGPLGGTRQSQGFQELAGLGGSATTLR
jgi:DNA repair exonuclease SbcCD ATPase subunit